MSTKSPNKDLTHVTDWVFDLDNTLYPRTCDLFAQIDSLMTDYVAKLMGMERAEARRLQKDYYRDYGTTLSGLMKHHDVDPEHYLSTVHDIDYSPVNAHPELVELIAALPGRKFIFTNADTGHATAVLERLGGLHLFDGMFDIKDTGYKPKPERSAYEGFLAEFNIAPERAAMFDDLQKNLMVPHDMGMRTVQVIAADDFVHDQVDDWELERAPDMDHIHHTTDDLVLFLRELKQF